MELKLQEILEANSVNAYTRLQEFVHSSQPKENGFYRVHVSITHNVLVDACLTLVISNGRPFSLMEEKDN